MNSARKRPAHQEPSNPAQTALHKNSALYRNRVCLKLTADPYIRLSRSFLAREHIRYARVPFRMQDEVYYFFESADASRKFLNFLVDNGAADALDVEAPALPSKFPVSSAGTISIPL